MKEEIIDILKSEIEYFKKVKSAIGDIHGHIHSLAVKVGKIYLASKYPQVKTWRLSEKFGGGIDIIGVNKDGKPIVAAEVKTTYRSEKETLGRPQRTRIRKDLEKLLETEAEYKYFFIIDNKNRRAIEGILKNISGADVSLINIFD